ncbi:MAG: hypothetical protein IJP27_04290 [Clostridia bacterium]|nr:hypothetical protein [Clostridia bacterium]
MDLLLILAVIVLYSLQTLFCKFYTNHYAGSDSKHASLAAPILGILQSAFIPIVTLAFIGFRFSASPITWLIGALNAVIVFGYNNALIQATRRGSYAFANMMLLFGEIVLMMIYCMNFVADYPTPGLAELLAIAGIGGAILLMNVEDFRFKGVKISYYVFCILLFLCNGFYGTLLKIQENYNAEESSEMIIISYALMGLLSLGQLFFQEKKELPKAFGMKRKAILYLALCLIVAASAINVFVYAIEMIQDTVILYTMLNGGVLVLAALYSVFLFNEKTSPLKIAGVILAAGCMAVLA